MVNTHTHTHTHITHTHIIATNVSSVIPYQYHQHISHIIIITINIIVTHIRITSFGIKYNTQMRTHTHTIVKTYESIPSRS
jgi:hypothetical protein